MREAIIVPYRNMIGAFARDTKGNIAMMFGLLAFVLLAAAGVAIDLQRTNVIRAGVHEAADAGLLAAARYKNKHPNASLSKLTEVARKVFDSSINNDAAIEILGFAITFDPDTDSYALDIGGKINTLIMGVFDQDFVNLDTRAEVKLGKTPLVEVALALDTTGSMNQKGKISTMRNAARDLVKTLFEEEDADVKIGVVPFAQYVNVGTAYAAAGWLDNPGGAWKGCVGSRAYPYNTEDGDYDTQKVPGLLGAPCPDELMPLSTDDDALDTMINNLKPNGFTYIPAGLAWAWRLLTPSDPFSEGESFATVAAERGTKALILMTDGQNTRAPDYPTHNNLSEMLANDLTKELCVNIKKQEIVIYTIAFEVTDPDIKDILEDCATTTSHYFDAADSAELIDAFASIAGSLRSISLSK